MNKEMNEEQYEQYERVRHYFHQGGVAIREHIYVVKDNIDKDSVNYDSLVSNIKIYDEINKTLFWAIKNKLNQTFIHSDDVLSFRDYCTERYFVHLDKINMFLSSIRSDIDSWGPNYNYLVRYYLELDKMFTELVHQFKLTWSMIWGNILSDELTKDLFEIGNN